MLPVNDPALLISCQSVWKIASIKMVYEMLFEIIDASCQVPVRNWLIFIDALSPKDVLWQTEQGSKDRQCNYVWISQFCTQSQHTDIIYNHFHEKIVKKIMSKFLFSTVPADGLAHRSRHDEDQFSDHASIYVWNLPALWNPGPWKGLGI